MRGSPSTLSRNSEQFYSAPRSPGFPPVLGDLDFNLTHTPTVPDRRAWFCAPSPPDAHRHSADITHSYHCSGVLFCCSLAKGVDPNRPN